MQRRRSSLARAAFSGVPAVLVAAGLVAAFDAVIEARVRAGSDDALRMSVLLPYLGIGSRYVLARAFGLAALVLAGAAVAIGLDRARRSDEGHTPGSLGGRLHQQLSVLALALVALHLVLPYTSSVTPYGGWPTALVPFAQPYAFGGSRGKVFESFGILAFYLMVLLGPSYWLLSRHRRVWGVFHGLTVGAYVLAVLHALFLGSDFVVRGPARVALVAVQLPITALVARRLLGGGAPPARQLGALVAVIVSLLVVALALAGIAGASLGGLPL